MAEWALYLDESGTTDPHRIPLPQGITPQFTLAGVILPLARWREYDREYLYLKREFFRAEIDRSSKDDTAWEIKGSALTAPRNRDSDRNTAFCYRVLGLIGRFGGQIIGVTFLKSLKNPLARVSMYTKGLQILAERFDIFLREANAEGLMIVDSRMAHTRKGGGLDYAVAQSYLSFVFGNDQGRLMKRLVEAPLFADSQLTAGLQIADMIAALVYASDYARKIAPEGAVPERGLLDYTHVRRFEKTLKDRVFISDNFYGGQRTYGLRLIDHRDSPNMLDLERLQKRFASVEP